MSRPALEEGSGEGKVLFFDAFSGVAGDMTIAALVDLGVPFQVVEGAVRQLPLRGVALLAARVEVSSIGATRFDVIVKGRQPERTYSEIDRMIASSGLARAVADRARAIFRRLGEAEAEVHRVPLDDVHFHEVGAVDAIVDVVGAAACLAWLGADVVSSPLPLGRGFVECRHGVLPLPAPAVVNCLRGAPTIPSGLDGVELVTPTGAAIVATVATGFAAWPGFSPERVGWGAGTRTLADRPNALRVVLGTRDAVQGAGAGTHVVLEANVDDITGELLGHAIRALLSEGALDAWAAPVTMKKGRPGWVFSVLGRRADRDRLADAVLRETSSIGVRVTEASRVERSRRVIQVETPFGTIPVKISGGAGGPAMVKPEFDACARAAGAAKVPVRVVVEAALVAARSVGALELEPGGFPAE